MNRRLLTALVVLTLGSFLAGCKTYTTYGGGIMTQTNVTLSQNNFRYVKLAVGAAEAEWRSRGFQTWDKIKGGPEYAGIVMQAKKDLLTKNPLKDGQALANITLDERVHYKGIFTKKITWKVTMTADIIEFR